MENYQREQVIQNFPQIKTKLEFIALRSKVDAILIGKNTAKIDDPVLSVHNTKKKNPIRIILDSAATISTTSRILKTCSKIPTIIVVSKKAQKKNLHKLEKFPIQIIVCGKYTVNIKKLLVILKKKGIKNILVEGGGITNWAFVKENLVDEANNYNHTLSCRRYVCNNISRW